MRNIFLIFFVFLFATSVYAASNPPLGSSTSITSPQRASDATTGLYSAGAGKVDVSISGSKIDEWTSSGESVTGTLAVSGATTTNITGSTQCVHANSSGVLSGTGSDCGAGGGSGTVTVVGAGNLTSTDIVTGGGSQTVQTPSTNATIDSSGNLSALSFTSGGVTPTKSGILILNGVTSGAVALGVADVAGAAITYVLPTTNGAANQFLYDSGSTTCPTDATGSPATCHALAWSTAATGTGANVLATSPTLVTPALGTPASGVMTNVTGTATGLTSGITNALASATTTVNVSSATAPSANQVLTATDSTHATWQAAGGGSSWGIFANTFVGGGMTVPNSGATTGCPLIGGNGCYSDDLTLTRMTAQWSGNVRNLCIYTYGTQDASGTATATLFINGSATALVATITAGGAQGVYCDTTHTVSYASGNTMNIIVKNNATAGTLTFLSTYGQIQ